MFSKTSEYYRKRPRAWSVVVQSISHVWCFATLWTAACQFPLFPTNSRSIKSLQFIWLFVTLWTVAPPGSSVHGILQARILEWVAIPSSRGSSQPRDWTCIFCIADISFIAESPEKPLRAWYLNVIKWKWWPHMRSQVRLFPWSRLILCYIGEVVESLNRVRVSATPSTVAHQAPPSMWFSRKEHWSGLPFPSLWDLPNPGIEPGSPTW